MAPATRPTTRCREYAGGPGLRLSIPYFSVTFLGGPPQRSLWTVIAFGVGRPRKLRLLTWDDPSNLVYRPSWRYDRRHDPGRGVPPLGILPLDVSGVLGLVALIPFSAGSPCAVTTGWRDGVTVEGRVTGSRR
jgi:hypothetical protein